jgi:L-ascorbate metabolism protein UlaG (beta-lactamase superfamily)
MAVTFTWFAHSAFWFDIDGHGVLVDPFLSGNPLNTIDPHGLEPEIILLSHAHGDHLGDTLDIALRTGALLAANFEIGQWMLNQGVRNVWQGNPGGTFDGGFMTAKWTRAHHSSSFPDGTYGGEPNGFVITGGGYRMYFAGDTSLFGDMSLIGDEGIDVAFLPIGDTFTMGIDDSIRAIGFIRPRFVVPMHYNTFPPIMQDAGNWANRVSSETEAAPIVLDPGKSYTLG